MSGRQRRPSWVVLPLLLVPTLMVGIPLAMVALGPSADARAHDVAEDLAAALVDHGSAEAFRSARMAGEPPTEPPGTTVQADGDDLVGRTTVRVGPASRCAKVRALPAADGGLEAAPPTITRGAC